MNFITDILHLFYPDLCFCCHSDLTKNEHIVCISCRHDLPETHFSTEKDNLVEKTFYGRIPLVSGTALFYFSKKSHVQALIHQLKYKNQQQIGKMLGHWLGKQLLASNRFNTINCIIPVPLHAKRFKKRGYNQVTTFGQSLSEELNIPVVNNNLVRISSTETQSKKLRLERSKNIKELFHVLDPTAFENKHILLIDDIITTGATLEACYLALQRIKNFKISIASMAYTK